MKKLFFALLLIGLSACHKTAPEEDLFLPPAFSIQGSLDGMDFDFTPGIDGRYMFTEHTILADGAHSFETTIQGIDGSGPQLSFGLYQSEENSSAEELLLALPNEELSLEVSQNDLSIFLQTDALNPEWTIAGEVYNSAQVEVPYLFPFSYTLVSIEESCAFATNVNYFLPNSCGTQQHFNPIDIEQLDDVLLLSPPELFGDFSLYLWQINGEVLVQNPDDVMTINVPNELESLEILLMGVDNMGSELPLIQQITTFFIFSDFCSTPEISSSIGLEAASNMTIEYTDLDGTTYKSADFCFNLVPSEESFFDVLEVSDYENNENNQPTKRITFNAQIELFNTENPIEEPLLLNLNNASIAFAY